MSSPAPLNPALLNPAERVADPINPGPITPGPINPAPSNPDYRWTPATQVSFLTAFAETGSVRQACEAAGKSRRAAYNLRFRRDGAAFRLGWDAAVLIARATLYDTLMDRVLDGSEDVTMRDPDTNITTRLRKDSRLGMALLTRLDRMASADNGDTAPLTDHTMARLISQDFEAFLSLIARGGEGAEAGLFLAARLELTPHRAGSIHENQCELGNFFCDDEDDSGDEEEEEEDEEESYAESLHVTFCPETDEWVTNFPPPEDFDGYETSTFGDQDYERELTPEELEVQVVRDAAERAPLRQLAMKARDQYFGFTPDCGAE
jgi:hypothetical protein